MTYDANNLPAGHLLTADSSGRPQVRCECCGVREWIDVNKTIRHLRWCDNAGKPVAPRRAASESAVARELRLADLAAKGLASSEHGLNRDFT